VIENTAVAHHMSGMLLNALEHWRSFIVLTMTGMVIAGLLCLKNGTLDPTYFVFGFTVGWCIWVCRVARVSLFP
jgi:hypothetical protein